MRMRSPFYVLAFLVLAASLASCGGGGSGGGNNTPPSGGSNPPPPPPQATVTFLHDFRADQGDGNGPNGPLVQASDGNFYGTTVNGGANACTTTNETNNCGTLFMMTPTGETTVLHSFGPTARDPIAPLSGLIEGTDGALYGTTVSGGGGNCNFAFSCGAVYRITMAGELTILYAFSLTSIEDGYGPSQLILASDGNFYGTTGSGGAHLGGDLEGTAFKLTPAGVLTTLYSFGPLHSKASNPVGGLVEGNDGTFYGLTAYSDSFPGTGSVFKLVPP